MQPATKRSERVVDTPRTVLMVKLAAIGDVAMALAVAPALAARAPGARLTWLCGDEVAPLVRLCPLVHEVLTVDERALLAGTRPARAKALLGLWRRLAGRRFDLVLTGHADPRYRVLTRPVRAGARRGFQRGARPWPVPGRNHADEYVRLVTGEDGPSAMRARVPELALPELDAELARELRGRGPLIALAPGGARNVLADDALRRWPLESYASLAKTLRADGARVVLTGGAGDEWVRAGFPSGSSIDLVGRTDLPQLLTLFASCDLVVGHDSAALHLARLARAPAVALFGPTNPGEKADLGATVLWGGARLACRPCYDGRRYADCDDNRCLKGITVEEVAAACRQRLARVGWER